MKTLIVVSGGDAPGINTLLARYTTLAHAHDDVVLGAMGSFAGLLNGDIIPLSPERVGPWASMPGSLLTTDRTPVLADESARPRLLQLLSDQAIDNIVLLGGNGSLTRIPPLLSEWGVACLGIPATIDNDVPGSQLTLGFDSACNFAHHSIDALLATARALPGRIFTVETLGGDTGFLALEVGVSAGAHAVLLPEYDYTNEWLSDRVSAMLARDGYALVVLSEGIHNRDTLSDDLAQATGARVRDVRLGHAQRGACPSHRDRWLASEMAEVAYWALKRGLLTGSLLVHGAKLWLLEDTITAFPPPKPDRTLYDRVNGFGWS